MDFGVSFKPPCGGCAYSFRLKHWHFQMAAAHFIVLVFSFCACLAGVHAQDKTPTSTEITSLHGLQFDFVPPLDNSYYRIGLDYCSGTYPPQQEPLSKIKWGAGVRFSRFTDSRGDKDLAVALGGYAAQPITNAPSLSLLVKLGLDIDYVWRKDDDDRYVNAFMLSLYPALSIETIRSHRTGLVISAGYRFSVLSEWQRPGKWADESLGEESEVTLGVWTGEAPTIDVGGVFLMVGLKLFVF